MGLFFHSVTGLLFVLWSRPADCVAFKFHYRDKKKANNLLHDMFVLPIFLA